MNETFNISRFGSYFTSDLKKCLSEYGLTLALLSALGIIVFIFVGMSSLVFTGGWYSIGEIGRFMVMAAAVIALIISFPSRCYGSLTEKRSGSMWLMIPASVFEKYLSMILNTAIVIPIVFFTATLVADGMLCLIVPDCGMSFIEMIGNIPAAAEAFLEQEPWAEPIKDMINPLLYIDDFAGTILIFLLGALIFKKNKGVMTILSIIAISSIIGIIATPFIVNGFVNKVEFFAENDPMEMLPFMKNIVTLDTINDMIVIIGLMIAIFFRIKTLKH